MDIGSFLSPKQIMEMKREIVEAGLARANPIVAMQYQNGILLVAENPSDSLNKISEIYDRIAFAGTGIYNDYERLRRAGVQYADLQGFSYSRRDVRARSLASEFSNILGDSFTRQQLPWEVEILVGELTDNGCRMYVILYSGALIEEKGFCVIGDIVRNREGELKKNVLRKALSDTGVTGEESLEQGFAKIHRAIASLKEGQRVDPRNLEVVVLDRTLKRDRKLRRLQVAEVEALMAES